jgi:hypothetical protein
LSSGRPFEFLKLSVAKRVAVRVAWD